MATSSPSAPGVGRSGKVGSASLLELVPEFGAGLASAERGAVRRSTPVTTVTVPPGPWTPSAFSTETDAFGFLVSEGAIIREVLIAGSVCSDLLGPGDVAGFGDEDATLVPAHVRWTVSAQSRVAILDTALLRCLEAFPVVTARLLARAARQTSTLAVQRAISQLPRVDQRLLALFWHLAERWGRVGRDGVVIRLALTHETLGRMVGARRPTVSLALKELAVEGSIVRRLDGAWVLRRDGRDRLVPAEDPVTEQPPDAAVLPDLGEPAPRAPLRSAPEPAMDLRGRIQRLDEVRVEQERRVQEVLARCEETRDQLSRSRRRQAERAARLDQRP